MYIDGDEYGVCVSATETHYYSILLNKFEWIIKVKWGSPTHDTPNQTKNMKIKNDEK